MLELFRRIKVDKGASVLFITHNLGVAAEVCDRVAVMYAGRLCEVGSVEDMFLHPLHPYTKALLDAVPMPGKEWQTIPGALADRVGPAAGLPFSPAVPERHTTVPARESQTQGGHRGPYGGLLSLLVYEHPGRHQKIEETLPDSRVVSSEGRWEQSGLLTASA